MTNRPTLRPLSAAIVVALAGGCGSEHHILDAASPDAAAIEWLWWVLFWVSAFVFVAVVVGWSFALWRRRPDQADALPEPEGNALRWIFVAGVAIPAVILVGLTATTILTGARLSEAARDADAIVIDVIGHQFWWEVRYPDAGVVTANEIHIPVDRSARLRLASNDVIHSLWVPRLHGKLDLTPGRVTELVLRAEQAGTYRGFCAEFCGTQHALMGLLVIAQPRAEFEAWLEAQARPAPAPDDAERALGRNLFIRHDCHHCHQVRGGGLDDLSQSVGPDLTHLASRRTIGSVTADNTTENLRRWILDPHRIKPGVLMPATPLSEAELTALVRYLEGSP
jgi:cytochrome c oxidase subunit II